jgi:PEP-CTERM motif
MRKTHSVVAALLVSLVGASVGGAANILFVHDMDLSGDGATPAYAAADTAMVNELTSLGHSVTLIDDAVVTAAAVSGLGSSDFVVLSSTAASGLFATNDSGDGNSGATNSLATAATIVLMEGGNAVLTAFNINTGGGLGTKLGTNINILADDGYVTAGLPLGSLSIYNVASNIGTWGAVAPQAAGLGFPQFDYLGTALASVPDGVFLISDVTTGVHSVGDNKIVLLPFQNGSFSNVNANGLKLFDNVFGAVPEPNSLAILLIGGGLWSVLQRRRKG